MDRLHSTGDHANFLAKPAGQCCLKGSLHKGQPRGFHTTIAGVDTYISQPSPEKANKHILLYFPDVWGFFPNGFLIMDGFADAGYLVLGLDYFRDASYYLHSSLNKGDEANPESRIRFGSTERTGAIYQIPILIMRPGKRSISLLPTMQSQNG
jgi:hypothetical protein